MNYQGSQNPHPSQRELDPYALVHRWGWWYVIGFCHLRQTIRTFRVDRMFEITLLDITFNPSVDFDLQAFLKAEPNTELQITARLRFQADAANFAFGNRSYWETIEPQADGSVEVTFLAPTFEWAASTTLAYGPAVEALSPPELRFMVAEWIEITARKYANEKGKHS
jgi:predicted DNA-binding transcriptional regulator YafY